MFCNALGTIVRGSRCTCASLRESVCMSLRHVVVQVVMFADRQHDIILTLLHAFERMDGD